MAHGIHARLSFAPALGRRFGLTVGGAFLVLAGVLAWRGMGTGATAVGALSVLLALGGLVIPGRLGPVYRAWMGFALALSKVTTPIVLGILYFGVLLPVGLVLRAIGRHPLRRQLRASSFWVARDQSGQSPERMRHLF